MTIAFREIVQTFRTNVHHTEFSNQLAARGANRKPHRILVTGFRLTAGTVAEGVLKQIFARDASDAEGYFGVGSQLAQMCRIAKLNNPYSEMWACALDEDSGGTAGTTTLTVTVTTALEGTIHLYLDGQYIPVTIAAGTAQDAVATAINAAIQAHSSYARLPWTSGVATNVVTLTKKWKGVDYEDVRCNYDPSDAFPGGVSVAVAAGATGATNPDVGDIITAIGDVTQYDTIINPWTDTTNLAAWKTEADLRFGGMVQKECAIYCGVLGTLSTATTLGLARNDKHMRLHGAEESPSAAWKWAAAIGATNALAIQIDPSAPRQTLPVLGVKPAESADRWSETDRNTALYAGVSTHVTDDGGNVTLETQITTYRTNAQSTLDESYLYQEGLDTLYAIRYDWRSAVSLAFPRHKLADDGGEIPGQDIMTPSLMKGFAHGRYTNVWGQLGWVDMSEAAQQQFLDDLITERPTGITQRLACQMSPDLINQFRGVDTKIAFIL